MARLVKKAVLAAGVRPDLTQTERAEKFSGHSLRAGIALAEPLHIADSLLFGLSDEL